MLNLLTREALPESASAEPLRSENVDHGDFEIVLGKRQIAGVLFLASVFLVLFSAVSYVAGKVTAPRRTVTVERPVPAPVPAPVPPPMATIISAPATIAAAPAPKPILTPGALFRDPEKGALYLQFGSVEKGIALIIAEGLRTHGFEAFVAPGASENVFRVLVGPLSNEEAYKRTKDATDRLGLTAFGRRYQE